MSDQPSSPPALRDVLRGAISALADAGVPDPAVDAELLVAAALGPDVSRGEVQTAIIRGDAMPERAGEALRAMLRRRRDREPLQHIVGAAPFRHLTLRVGPGVFVPRPETEQVAQLAVDALRSAAEPEPIAVDLGTGSGAIALALATEVPHARIHAVERSDEAIVWTRRNVDAIAPRVDLRHGDLDAALDDLAGTVAVIVSNPPYVPHEAIPRDPEVRLHDPAAALYGGPDGLDPIRTISRVGLRLGRPGAVIVLEHGEWQGGAVRAILAADGWQATATHPDLTQRDRATTALRPA
ncbi:peptide chain release factor N(5)-glutamine methyltransferase [Microbacterium sp. gxy059]|uniref:peptide chain release factor N(5)-glutamine methyltransferase n=1 Tax=Microbacterium sp. gxy059 TaxID=2957199 RepID=UPI003D980313